MKLKDALSDRVCCDKAIDEDGVLLTDAVGAVGCLLLDGGVSPRNEDKNVIGGGKGKANATRFEADGENWWAIW